MDKDISQIVKLSIDFLFFLSHDCFLPLDEGSFLQKLPNNTGNNNNFSSQTQILPHQHDPTPIMPSSSTMPLSLEPPFLCANEAVIAGLLDAESHHMPEKDYLRHCRDSSVDITTCLAAFAPGLFVVKVVSCLELNRSLYMESRVHRRNSICHITVCSNAEEFARYRSLA
ncbi:hypothetical protein HKD37_13G037296 [Glycine soja]